METVKFLIKSLPDDSIITPCDTLTQAYISTETYYTCQTKEYGLYLNLKVSWSSCKRRS